MLSLKTLSSLLVPICIFIIAQPCLSANWDYFVFTQQWPMAACLKENATKQDCKIPLNVTTWTIHGLWPNDLDHPKEPVNCNSSWKFEERKILTLEDKMKKYWPNLFVEPKQQYSAFWAQMSLFYVWELPVTCLVVVVFWVPLGFHPLMKLACCCIGERFLSVMLEINQSRAHEWSKHGTCSTDLPATADEFLYFSQSLLLNEKYNLTGWLEEYDIKPGRNYSFQEFNSTLTKILKYPPMMECVLDKVPEEEEKQYIFQIEICLSKEFLPIKCPHNPQRKNQFLKKHKYSAIESGECSERKKIKYLRISHQ